MYFIKHFTGKIVTAFFTCAFAVYSFAGGVLKVPESTPENFNAILRFAICSDIHIGKTDAQGDSVAQFSKMFDVAYAESENSSHKTLDAVIVAGDMTDSGSEEQYQVFKSVYSQKLKSETAFICCMGNHEFIDYKDNGISDEEAFKMFEKYANSELDSHVVINGYHFISISYSDSQENFDEKIDYLKEQLEIASKDTPDKPIFVIQHPHAFATVYGSVNWADIKIRAVLEKYPQVVDFSGHSHYAANDPRSVWQGSFTAVGTGAITGSMGNLGYISGDQYGQGDSGTFWLVEADSEGNIRMRLYDLVSDCFFEDCEYYFKNVSQKQNRVYNWLNMYSLDTRPVFSDDTEITSSTNENGESVLSFIGAKGYFDAESYKIKLTNENGKTVFADTVLSGYTRATNETIVNVGVLEKGTYKVSVKAYSPYAKAGETLTAKIVIE